MSTERTAGADLPHAVRHRSCWRRSWSSARSRSRPKAFCRCRPTACRCAGSGRSRSYPEFVRAFWRQPRGSARCRPASRVLFAVPAALAIARYRFRGREALTALFLSPLMIPHVVLGIAFLRFFTSVGLGGTFCGAGARARRHRVAVRAAADAGVGGRPRPRGRAWPRSRSAPAAGRVFRRVTLPLILPGVASGWVLAFIQSFDEVTMTVFIAAPGTETLPVRMFLYIQDNIDPLVTSVSACVIAVTVIVLIAARPRLRARPRCWSEGRHGTIGEPC